MPEKYDVLVLGAGPAGIAAARHISKTEASFLVLEARSRVGGRAFASDALNASRILDHGARWIHGSCGENSMVKLVADMEFDHPEDVGVEYEIHLPNMHSQSEELDAAPPFELSGSEAEEEESVLIVKVKNSELKAAPTKNLTKVLMPQNGGILAKEPSSNARRSAKKIFKDVVQSIIKNPQKALKAENFDSIDEEQINNASIMDILLWLHQGKTTNKKSEEQKQHQFASLCREQLVMQHEHVEEAVASLVTEEERTSFREEVLALFNLEIYTVLECWEGAPIHGLSAKNGMEGTLLPGGNMIMPFGYGGLVKRLAHSLESNKHIRLQHRVLSVTSNKTTDNGIPNVVVRCRVTNEYGIESTQEFHASACIVALPLGVLRAAVGEEEISNKFSFEPPLPSPLTHTIQSLGITVRDKVELLFETCWWPPDIGRFSLACAHLQQSPTYHPYSTFIVESSSHLSQTTECPNILVCYVAGEFAKETEAKRDDQVQEECMAVLRQSQMGETQTIPDPIAIHVTRWLQDPYSRGAWTFYGKGSAPEDVRQFRENPECQVRQLFFAGEHTCHGGTVKGDDMGCVHGAWVSGELAADAALKSIGKQKQ